MNENFIIDVNVLIDAWIHTRANHADARTFFEKAKEKNANLFMPSFAFLELTSALLCEKRVKPELQGSDIVEPAENKIHFYDIDKNFILECCEGPYPRLSGGDMAYSLAARKWNYSLITGDKKMRSQTIEIGGTSRTISEQLEQWNA